MQAQFIVNWENLYVLRQHITPEQTIGWLTGLAILIAIGYYVCSKIRANTLQSEPTAHELLAKFDELHSQGELSDEEFRTIKTTLSEKLDMELSEELRAMKAALAAKHESDLRDSGGNGFTGTQGT